jgi:hypothetical protein
MSEEWPCRCLGRSAALIVDAPINILTRWPEIIARYGFKRVAMSRGWEQFELENTMPLDFPVSAACDAIYLGDLVTRDMRCPRCHVPVYEAISGS